jgi:hypothetical protein
MDGALLGHRDFLKRDLTRQGAKSPGVPLKMRPALIGDGQCRTLKKGNVKAAGPRTVSCASGFRSESKDRSRE